MPKIAIISDIHSNLEALAAVIDDMEANTVEQVICMGDMVGYCADPQPVLRMIRNLLASYGNLPALIGNHDHCIGYGMFEDLSPNARSASEWTRDRLNEEEREWLQKCPFTYRLNDAFFVHASPYYPQAWHYIVHEEQAEAQFNFFKGRICFIGHSHTPFIFKQGGERFSDKPSLILAPGERYLVNVGSVGQPRDNDPRACYAVYDSESGLVILRRITYDVASAASKIREAGLPAKLADRLLKGT